MSYVDEETISVAITGVEDDVIIEVWTMSSELEPLEISDVFIFLDVSGVDDIVGTLGWMEVVDSSSVELDELTVAEDSSIIVWDGEIDDDIDDRTDGDIDWDCAILVAESFIEVLIPSVNKTDEYVSELLNCKDGDDEDSDMDDVS